MFSQNDILMVNPNRQACFDGIVRVVATSDDGVTLALFRMDLPRPYAPFIRKTSEIVAALEDQSIQPLQNFETNLPASANELSTKKQKKLNDAIKLMTPLMGDILLIMDSEYRGCEFKRHALRENVHERTIRRYFYMYLWGGMTDLALAGTQKIKSTGPKQQSANTARRGPKPGAPETASHVTLPQVRSQLEDGAKLYFLLGKYTQLEAYVLTLKKYYSQGKQVIKKNAQLLELEDILLPTNKRPSYGQFRYICDLLKAESGDREKKPRQIQATRQKTEKRGKARHGIHGPGYRFEIDATRLQIRIVSRFSRRNLVREATLYIIIDVWSGAIVGYAISLEPAGWALAAKALRNCFTDKTEVFKRLDLPYNSSDWVAKHLPSRLAADRAELLSNKAGIVPEIGIKVEIMPSMCPERKGSVEGKFEKIKYGDNFYKKPGRHVKNPQRRQPNGKKEAAYTLRELEQLIVEIIIDLNNDPVPIANIPAEALKSGRTAITYGGLFEWGLKHRIGFTRTLSPKQVFSSLLLRGIGSVTAEGIHFRKMNFFSKALFELGLSQIAARKGAFEIEIRYDDHFCNEIWILNTQTQEWVAAYNDNEEVARLNASFWELEDFLRAAHEMAFNVKAENILKKHEKAKRINKTANTAVAEAKAEKRGKGKAQTKAQILVNTAVEITAERLLQAKATQASFASAINNQQIKPSSVKEKTAIQNEVASPRSQSVGKRALELWRKLNVSLDK